jgi:Phospholipase_D-nuclease N-terminal
VITKGPNMHVLAATWGLGEVLWAMLVFFFWVCAIFLFIWVVIDIFQRLDIGGGAKAIWLLVVFFLPVIGCVIYLIARPPQPGEAL